jgi:hypothetical protein
MAAITHCVGVARRRPRWTLDTPIEDTVCPDDLRDGKTRVALRSTHATKIPTDRQTSR